MKEDVTEIWCEICRNLSPHCPFDFRETDWPHHDGRIVQKLRRESREVQVTGQEGCRICYAISEATQYFHRRYQMPENSENSENAYYLEIQILENNFTYVVISGGPALRLQLYTPVGFQPAWKNILVAPDLSSTPNSAEAIAFIEGCIKNCAEKHTVCHQMTPFLPTRLLDLENLGSGSIRLVETGLEATGRYVALSYCWGTAEVFRTMKANYPFVEAGIPIEVLPRSIQDAAHISKNLGFRYLWVDALCIIQDSAEDWDAESARMGSVYENAYVTLVAALASSAAEGFISHFSPSILKNHFQPELPNTSRDTFTLELPAADGSASELRIVKARIATKTFEHDTDITDNPLDTRAWCFQEGVLSTRAILFTKEEIRWSCRSAKACECQIDYHAQQHWPLINEIQSSSDAYLFWTQAVQRYSYRRLTKNMDKLVALSGLAQVVQRYTDAKYLAGIWSGNLITGLAWQRTRYPMEDLSKYWGFVAEYLAPTFSWASIHGVVTFLDGPETTGSHTWVQKFSLEDMNSTPTSQNPHGAVSGGYIKLHGNVIQATLQYGNKGKSGSWYNVVTASRPKQHWLHQGIDTDIEDFIFINNQGQEEKTIRRSVSVPPAPGVPVPPNFFSAHPIFLFYLGILQRDESLEWNSGSHIFIILSKSPRSPTTCYERLGLLKTEEYREEDWPELRNSSSLANITIV